MKRKTRKIINYFDNFSCKFYSETKDCYLFRNRKFSLILFLFSSLLAFPNTTTDSLVRFSDLRFQSEFEKQSFVNLKKCDEFSLCLSSEKNMTTDIAISLKNDYSEMLKILDKEKFTTYNLRNKYCKASKIIFSKSPMQYSDYAEFSDILKNGNFNFVTASAFLSLSLRELNYPVYFLYSKSKADVIIDLSPEQIIFDTGTKKKEAGNFNTPENKNYIVDLLDANLRFNLDGLNKSTGANIEGRNKDSVQLGNNQLAATIYFVKSFQKSNLEEFEQAYELICKAFYLYPAELFKTNLYAMLTNNINHCNFDKEEDIDLLGQLLKFKKNDFDYIKSTFYEIVSNRIAKKNDLRFCTSIYNRLLPQVHNTSLVNEISYMYYICASLYKNDSIINLRPTIQALKLKPNDSDAINLIHNGLIDMTEQRENHETVLDTLNVYEKLLDNKEVLDHLYNVKWMKQLDIAQKYFMNNKPEEGLKYLSVFESEFKLPIPDTHFRIKIENAYYEYARYLMRVENTEMAKKIVAKGLEYVPNSNLIQSAIVVVTIEKQKVTRYKMTKSEYQKLMKSRSSL